MRIIGRFVPQTDITASQRDQMHSLLDAHFEGASRGRFERNLEEKNWVILLEREDCGLVGFSTLLSYRTTYAGRPLSIVCSGDTIVRRDARNSSALPRAFLACIELIRQQRPDDEHHWLLITSGFRTYRLLPLFTRTFYPCFRRTTPPDVQAMIDALAAARFGSAYDRTTGVVRFPSPQPLREHLTTIAHERLADPHARWFARRNPGHAAGDELVCLAELSASNFTPAARRLLDPAAVRDRDAVEGAQ